MGHCRLPCHPRFISSLMYENTFLTIKTTDAHFALYKIIEFTILGETLIWSNAIIVQQVGLVPWRWQYKVYTRDLGRFPFHLAQHMVNATQVLAITIICCKMK